jgi:Mrp family chromosome partitioning ATPase
MVPKRFAGLVPKLRASEYDYIIFDMPAINQTSVTAKLAGMLDMTFLVVESEKTTEETAKRAAALLAESRAQVATVLNKHQTYAPGQREQELV